jgi:hypothetical protein
LYKHDLSYPLWTPVQKSLYAKQLERNSLKRLQPINGAEDYFAKELRSNFHCLINEDAKERVSQKPENARATR